MTEDNDNKAVWQFRFLKTIMDEIPIYIKDLAPSVVSPDTLRKMRRGKPVTHKKCMEVKNAIYKNKKAKRVIDKYLDELIVTKGHRDSPLTSKMILEEMRLKDGSNDNEREK